MNVLIALGLIALGVVIDALYQRRIRICECYAYETGYKQGKKEEEIRNEEWSVVAEYARARETVMSHLPASPMPDNFEEHMRKHGRAVARIK